MKSINNTRAPFAQFDPSIAAIMAPTIDNIREQNVKNAKYHRQLKLTSIELKSEADKLAATLDIETAEKEAQGTRFQAGGSIGAAVSHGIAGGMQVGGFIAAVKNNPVDNLKNSQKLIQERIKSDDALSSSSTPDPTAITSPEAEAALKRIKADISEGKEIKLADVEKLSQAQLKEIDTELTNIHIPRAEKEQAQKQEKWFQFNNIVGKLGEAASNTVQGAMQFCTANTQAEKGKLQAGEQLAKSASANMADQVNQSSRQADEEMAEANKNNEWLIAAGRVSSPA